MVMSPLPTSAAGSVRGAVPLPFTGCEQGEAEAGGAAIAAWDGQRIELPGDPGAVLALRNSIRVMLLAAAPATVALSVMGGPLRGAHMQGLPLHPVPLPRAVVPAVAVMFAGAAVGTARLVTFRQSDAACCCSSRASNCAANVAPVAGAVIVPVQRVGEVSGGPDKAIAVAVPNAGEEVHDEPAGAVFTVTLV